MSKEETVQGELKLNLDGEPIVIKKKLGRPCKARTLTQLDFSQEDRIKAAAQYCVLGNIKQVADNLHFPEHIVRGWSQEVWWSEVQKQIMLEQNDGLLAKINSTIDEALVMLEDRILKGDCEIIPARIGKDGNIISEETEVRVPIKARDLSQIFHALTVQRNILSGNDPGALGKNSSTTESRLTKLQEEFTRFSQSHTIEGESKEAH